MPTSHVNVLPPPLLCHIDVAPATIERLEASYLFLLLVLQRILTIYDIIYVDYLSVFVQNTELKLLTSSSTTVCPYSDKRQQLLVVFNLKQLGTVVFNRCHSEQGDSI